MKILVIIFLLFSIQLNSQTKLEGVVIDSESHEKIELASILLLDANDTTKIKGLTVSDLNGYFVFDFVPLGEYYLQLEHLSFFPVREMVEIDSAVKTITIFMEPKTTSLSEVSVKASRSKLYPDRTEYTITKSDRKMKVNALDLLAAIPEIDVDIVQRTVKTMSRGRVKILLNGRDANVDDIIALSKKNVIRLDYYDIPQMRYAMQGVQSVIDVITIDIPKGWKMGLGLVNAVSTTYGRDNVSFGLNLGTFYANVRSKFAYQHRKKWIVDETIAYEINDTLFQRDKKGIKGHRKLMMHTPVIGAGFFKRDKYDIYLKYSFSGMNSNNNFNQDVGFRSSFLSERRLLRKKSDYLRKNHTLDLYVFKKIWGGNDITANFLYSSYDNTSNSLILEKNILDSMTLSLPYQSKSTKRKMLSELYYTQYFKKWKLNVGGKSTRSILHILDTIVANQEIAANSFAFVEGVGGINKFTCQLSLGAVWNSFLEKQGDRSFQKIGFYPKVSIKYLLNDKGYWKLFYDFQSINPPLSLLTTERIKIDEHLWKSGSLALRPYGVHNANLTFFLKPSSFFYWTNIAFKEIKHPTIFDYSKYSNAILLQPINVDFFSIYSVALSVGGDFMKKKLNLRTYSQFQKTKIQNDGLTWARFYYYGSVSGAFKYHDFLLKLSLATPYHTLSGKVEHVQSESSTISVFWNKLRYSIGVNYSYFLSNSWGSSSKTISESLVRYTYSSQMYDVDKFLTFSVNYHFSKGQLSRIGRKKLKNTDNDSGVLE